MLFKALQIILMFGQNVVEIATSRHSDIFLIYLNSALVRTETMSLAVWLHGEEPSTLTSEGCRHWSRNYACHCFQLTFSLGAL